MVVVAYMTFSLHLPSNLLLRYTCNDIWCFIVKHHLCMYVCMYVHVCVCVCVCVCVHVCEHCTYVFLEEVVVWSAECEV